MTNRTHPIKPFACDLTEAEIAEVQEGTAKILRSGALVLGEYTESFEREFGRFVGARYAVSVNSGTKRRCAAPGAASVTDTCSSCVV